jgi:TolB protein
MKHILLLIIIGALPVITACDENPEKPNYLPVYTDSESDWSPDGSRIVFQRSFSYIHDTDPGMYFYNFTDSSLTLFMEGDGYTSPRFSPDGQWIVFSYMKNIYKIKADGDSLTQLTFTTDNYCPDWSPDGTRIVYELRGGDDRGIHILDLETLEHKLIIPYSQMPAWFSDGKRIAVIGNNFQSGPEIAVIDTLGNILIRLTDNDAFKIDPAVSFDGTKICFLQQFPEVLAELWIINTDGTDLKKLTNHGGDFPSFSPDGEWIVYTHTGSKDGSLWLMHPDGSGKRQLTSFE